jgi:hypothetical protein
MRLERSREGVYSRLAHRRAVCEMMEMRGGSFTAFFVASPATVEPTHFTSDTDADVERAWCIVHDYVNDVWCVMCTFHGVWRQVGAPGVWQMIDVR